MIDGATGLGDPIVSTTSDAAWLAHRASALFASHALAPDTPSLMMKVARDLETQFLAEQRRAPKDRWEVPVASFMLLTALDRDEVELAWLGDCRAILIGADGAVSGFGATPESEAREANDVPTAIRDPAERLRQPDALAQLRAGRARFNQPGRPAILAPEQVFAPHVKTARIALQRPAHALLMTDGFAALELRFRELDARDFIAAAREQGLAKLGVRLRKIEEEDDPEAVKFPRWKRSDDATAALILVP